MTELLDFAKGTLTNQAFLQIFVGGATFLLIAYMVIRARGDREAVPPPAPQTLADVPGPFLHGPREVLDILRELRDHGRRGVDIVERIADCARQVREESKRQTEILERIAREQEIENRAHGRERP